MCVIGSAVGEDFFPYWLSGRAKLTIGGNQFRVVGVLEKREHFCGGDSDSENSVIYMPFNVARKLKPNSDDV